MVRKFANQTRKRVANYQGVCHSENEMRKQSGDEQRQNWQRPCPGARGGCRCPCPTAACAGSWSSMQLLWLLRMCTGWISSAELSCISLIVVLLHWSISLAAADSTGVTGTHKNRHSYSMSGFDWLGVLCGKMSPSIARQSSWVCASRGRWPRDPCGRAVNCAGHRVVQCITRCQPGVRRQRHVVPRPVCPTRAGCHRCSTRPSAVDACWCCRRG